FKSNDTLLKIVTVTGVRFGLNTAMKYRPAFNGGLSNLLIESDPPGGLINAPLSKAVSVGNAPRRRNNCTGFGVAPEIVIDTVKLVASGGTSMKSKKND